MKKNYTLLFTLLISVASFGQTTFFSYSFEDNGNGTTYNTSVVEFSDSFYDFFTSTFNNDVGGSNSSYGVNGQDGTHYFAAQDLGAEGGPTLTTLTMDVDISGKSNLGLKILIAEDDYADPKWDASDYVHIDYSIDGGTAQNYLWIEAEGGDDSETKVDTDFDGIGDGITIPEIFHDFQGALSGTGSTLTITITFNLDSGNEDIAIDNIRIIDGFAGACNLVLQTETYTCSTNTIGGDNDGATINIPYTGSDTTITSVSTTSGGIIGGDNPSTTADGTITITGLSEGDAWDITVNGGNCDGSSSSSTIPTDQCDPPRSTCFDLSTGSELFDLVVVTANSQSEEWTYTEGIYDMNGYVGNGVQEQVETWLVFGPLDMTSVTDLVLAFDAVEGYSGTDLVVAYASSYSGCPSGTSWTTAETLTATGSYDVNLSAASGTDIYIGIQYVDDGVDGYSGWSLSYVVLEGHGSCPTLGTRPTSNCQTAGVVENQIEGFALYPNPVTNGEFTISSNNSIEKNIAIYSVIGKQIYSKRVKSNEIIDISNLTTGFYIVRVEEEGQIATRKLIVK